MIHYNKPDLKIFDLISPFTSVIVDYRKKVENWFINYTGNQFNIFTDSCKSALYFLYSSLDKKGKVAISPLTCFTSIIPLIAGGFRPYYIDIDPNTFNIAPECLEKTIQNENISAIQVIHFGGNPSEMEEITSLCKHKNILLIEDCAQSLGATYNNKNTGTWGDVSCFSFMKNMTATGGGLISLNNNKLADQIRERASAINKKKYFLRFYRYFNLLCDIYSDYKLFNILKNLLLTIRDRKIEKNFFRDIKWLQDKIYSASSWDASLAFFQLQSINDLIRKRQYFAKIYNDSFQNKHHFSIQKSEKNGNNIYTKYFLKTNKKSKILIDELLSETIQVRHLENTHTSIFQTRIDYQKLLYDSSIYQCKNYLKIHDYLISIPISSNMNKSEVDYVIYKIHEKCSN